MFGCWQQTASECRYADDNADQSALPLYTFSPAYVTLYIFFPACVTLYVSPCTSSSLHVSPRIYFVSAFGGQLHPLSCSCWAIHSFIHCSLDFKGRWGQPWPLDQYTENVKQRFPTDVKHLWKPSCSQLTHSKLNQRLCPNCAATRLFLCPKHSLKNLAMTLGSCRVKKKTM